MTLGRITGYSWRPLSWRSCTFPSPVHFSNVGSPVGRIPLYSFVLASLATPLEAQDIGAELSVLTSENAEGYVGPLARGLGHALTAGFVSSADPHGMLGFSIGVRVAGARFLDEDETFPVMLPSSVTYGNRTYTNPYTASANGISPTVAGAGAGVVLSPSGQFRSDLILAGQNPDTFYVTFPEGLELPLAPFAAIDATLGIGFGTQLMARVFPTIDVVGVGEMSAFGFGIMHNLTRYLPIPTPFWDVSVVVGTQKLELGSYLTASGNTLGLVASAGLGPLSAYAHASTYQATVDLDYTVENAGGNPGLPDDGLRIRFESEVERTQRLAVGAQLDLILLKASAEYGMGDYGTLSARVAFGFR